MDPNLEQIGKRLLAELNETDHTGEIVMFIPGQVGEGKLLSFMEDWQRENTVGGKRARDAANPGRTGPRGN